MKIVLGMVFLADLLLIIGELFEMNQLIFLTDKIM
jgi:hypothetical protein